MGVDGITDRHNLLVIDSGEQVREYDLTQFGKERVTVGRNAENDIQLYSPVVSGAHGKFKLIDGQMYFADLGSTNGTFVEGIGANKFLRGNRNYYPLQDGAVLKIKFYKNGNEDSVLLLYNKIKENGVWRRFPIQADVIRIGRNPDNDIVLDNPSVSRLHAVIEKCQGGYQIRDNHSLNGVLVNGAILKGTYLLKEKDVIRIFHSQMIYTHGCLYYKNSGEGISLGVRNINKYVGRGSQRKQILTNVTLDIGSNEFVAIIGGSGAGKSTLMNAISGFDKRVEGVVYCNGIELQKNFHVLKNMIGYVPQQDIIYENLTLRKMLYYTAKLKMPPDTSKEEIRSRIDKVLQMVELSEHQDTYIRKLSGGQKKRASIAVELLADPSLFFLDEPTSGLDPGTEKKLMQTLSKLSKTQGKTIIMVTHTTQNLHLCDKVIFMGPGGRLCFCGTTERAKLFFQTDDLVNIYNMIADQPGYWADQFAKCVMNEEEQQQRSQIDTRKGRVNGFRQMMILTVRYAQLIWNDKPRLLMLLLQPVLIAVLLAIVAADDVFELYGDTKSILFALSCAGIWIGLFNSIQEICKERVILKREYMGNLKLYAYILSKYNIQIMIGLIQALLLTGIFMAAVGTPEKGILFKPAQVEMILLMWLTILASMAMGLVVSGLVKSGDKAMTVAPFLLIIQLLFSGILFQLHGLGSKIAYCTISKWSVEGLGSLTDLNNMITQMEKDFPMYERQTEEMFECTKEHILICMVVMLGYMLICGVITTIVLRNVSKDSR